VLGTDRDSHIHVKIRSLDHGVLTTELYFPGDQHDARRRTDKVYEGHAQQEDFLVDLLDSHLGAPDRVPVVAGARYYRKDLYFL
jgi:protocatechuate 3,4-dioxygenase beta subunit